jgi:hypothetical protein
MALAIFRKYKITFYTVYYEREVNNLTFLREKFI